MRIFAFLFQSYFVTNTTDYRHIYPKRSSPSPDMFVRSRVMLRLSLFAGIAVVFVVTDASAATHQHSYRAYQLSHNAYQHSHGGHWRQNAFGGGEVVAHPAGCPRTSFCGCGAARELGLSDRSLWLARSWYRFPRAAAAPGMAALWGTRHVAVIRAVNGDGSATVYDANSGGGLTRVHRVSLAGLTIVNPSGGSMLASHEPERPRQRYAAAAPRRARYAYASQEPSPEARAETFAPHEPARLRQRYAELTPRRTRYAYQSWDSSPEARAQMLVSFVR
jgi:hypothetical protein